MLQSQCAGVAVAEFYQDIDWSVEDLDLVESLSAACQQLHGSKQPVHLMTEMPTGLSGRKEGERLSAAAVVVYQDGLASTWEWVAELAVNCIASDGIHI